MAALFLGSLVCFCSLWTLVQAVVFLTTVRRAPVHIVAPCTLRVHFSIHLNRGCSAANKLEPTRPNF